MSLDISKSITLNGSSLVNGSSSQGRMSANISKGNQVAINIYLDDPETLDQVSARQDTIQFVAQTFAQLAQVVPPKKAEAPTKEPEKPVVDNKKPEVASPSAGKVPTPGTTPSASSSATTEKEANASK